MSKTIILSIKPQFANAIFERKKIYEFRRIRIKDDIKKILIYASSPEQQVIGEIFVEEIIIRSIKELWRLTKQGAGIDYPYYMDYFMGKEQGCAIKISKVKRYKKPKCLRKDFDIHFAPQSFVYLKQHG